LKGGSQGRQEGRKESKERIAGRKESKEGIEGRKGSKGPAAMMMTF
jgi:hypothetical protein